MRRRRQGRKSPGNNSSAQEAAAWPGAACGTGPVGRGPHRLLLLLPKAQPGWGHGQMRRGGGARCENRTSPDMGGGRGGGEFEDFRGGSSSSQGKPSSSPPPFWPGWGKPGKHSVAELGGIAQKGKQAQRHLGTFRLHSLCPVHHTDALGLKKKLFSRPSHTGWAGPQDGAGPGARHGDPTRHQQ